MIDLKKLEIWLVTGSQHLYGEIALKQVAQHSQEIASAINADSHIPVTVVYKPIVTTPEEIYAVCMEANAAANCIGVVVWMHTFSPAKMWIRGLKALKKPVCHLHTQYNRDIPWSEIDMDFMNLNQSAHGDRELGFMMSRMRMNRKVITGHWKDPEVLAELGSWSRVAAGWHDWQGARFVRFGDNMRYVAVTDGDKVEAESVFGFSCNTHGIGDLVAVINSIPANAVKTLVDEYAASYTISPALLNDPALQDAAKIELGLKAFLEDGNYKGFSDTFEDLHGMVQLPGIAVQRLMKAGYGFAGEGDWKTAALVRAMKVMGSGLPGGNSFMEDYTYHFDPQNPMVLGAHMLEICESIADGKPSCEKHPLGIGGKADPVRLVFNTAGGPAINASIVDMGNRFRLLVNEVEAVAPQHELPKLPVARVLWKPYPDMKKACTAWILAGGAHHTCFSQNLTAVQMQDFANIAGIELALIDKHTELRNFQNELRWNDAAF
ncbi:L-arabinose isomerase [Chitinophaga terrae (ex Kim and Jung 2007)]|uniref:L-arabinose isomerase n=1 Tax=Chitinophaga terrae (ex Kim and Jung 2007) TaxID=408074 RepID=A0A1H3YV44_9BACT|nr:L-arabinose isomerase [Chitinophaga terrae (ex Kim and Jung 2007)]MDQ0107242.1 L-arabinose isomerase [Chitinophaga terrae (ex Kim and Jung 2007)]GEP88524.1 L-arabinose isomerase [Chitinophaga terrae (ex Kim and Jung 2007)]SEA15433.1 L-arabinose isomerase [Chitinophaga terrae (ex Kim and Jung 2007)]